MSSRKDASKDVSSIVNALSPRHKEKVTPPRLSKQHENRGEENTATSGFAKLGLGLSSLKGITKSQTTHIIRGKTPSKTVTGTSTGTSTGTGAAPVPVPVPSQVTKPVSAPRSRNELYRRSQMLSALSVDSSGSGTSGGVGIGASGNGSVVGGGGSVSVSVHGSGTGSKLSHILFRGRGAQSVSSNTTTIPEVSEKPKLGGSIKEVDEGGKDDAEKELGKIIEVVEMEYISKANSSVTSPSPSPSPSRKDGEEIQEKLKLPRERHSEFSKSPNSKIPIRKFESKRAVKSPKHDAGILDRQEEFQDLHLEIQLHDLRLEMEKVVNERDKLRAEAEKFSQERENFRIQLEKANERQELQAKVRQIQSDRITKKEENNGENEVKTEVEDSDKEKLPVDKQDITQLYEEIEEMALQNHVLKQELESKNETLTKMASELNRLCDINEQNQQETNLLKSDNHKLATYVTQLEQDIEFLQEDIDEQLKLRDQEVDHVLGDVEMLVAKLNELGCSVKFTDNGLAFEK